MESLRDRVVDGLRASEAELRAKGVLSLALAGSTARDAARPDSDVDIVVDVDPQYRIGVFALVDIRDRIESHIGRTADLRERAALRPEVRVAMERDAIRIF